MSLSYPIFLRWWNAKHWGNDPWHMRRADLLPGCTGSWWWNVHDRANWSASSSSDCKKMGTVKKGFNIFYIYIRKFRAPTQILLGCNLTKKIQSYLSLGVPGLNRKKLLNFGFWLKASAAEPAAVFSMLFKFCDVTSVCLSAASEGKRARNSKPSSNPASLYFLTCGCIFI